MIPCRNFPARVGTFLWLMSIMVVDPNYTTDALASIMAQRVGKRQRVTRSVRRQAAVCRCLGPDPHLLKARCTHIILCSYMRACQPCGIHARFPPTLPPVAHYTSARGCTELFQEVHVPGTPLNAESMSRVQGHLPGLDDGDIRV